MIQFPTKPVADTYEIAGRDDEDDVSSVDFKSHLKNLGSSSRPRPEQPKARAKKPTAPGNSSKLDAPEMAQTWAESPKPLTDLGAAITRALATLQGPGGTQDVATATALAATTHDAPQTPDATPGAMIDATIDESTVPLTPLEQAVRDIIAALPQPRPAPEHETSTDEESPHKPSDTPVSTTVIAGIAEPAKQAPVARTIVQEPAPIAEPNATELPAATSHMHLVLGDGDDRIVLTVAVRGQDINVSLRGSDDQTAAALARNAASLDHAMRGRGLDLASFSADRDPDNHHSRRDQPERQRARDDVAEPFVLEDKS